jgi:hypothetical protein
MTVMVFVAISTAIVRDIGFALTGFASGGMAFSLSIRGTGDWLAVFGAEALAQVAVKGKHPAACQAAA